MLVTCADERTRWARTGAEKLIRRPVLAPWAAMGSGPRVEAVVGRYLDQLCRPDPDGRSAELDNQGNE